MKIHKKNLFLGFFDFYLFLWHNGLFYLRFYREYVNLSFFSLLSVYTFSSAFGSGSFSVDLISS